MTDWALVGRGLEQSARADGIAKIVVAGIIMKRHRVLLLKRRAGDFLEGLFELPSGGMDEGEGVIEALQREVKEETNFTLVAVRHYVGHFDYRSASGRKARQLNFAIETEGELKLDPAEHCEAVWTPLSSIEAWKDRISNETLAILQHARSGRKR